MRRHTSASTSATVCLATTEQTKQTETATPPETRALSETGARPDTPTPRTFPTPMMPRSLSPSCANALATANEVKPLTRATFRTPVMPRSSRAPCAGGLATADVVKPLSPTESVAAREPIAPSKPIAQNDGIVPFELPEALLASEPPEARGLRRDQVRLLVSHLEGWIEHVRFHELPQLLRAGDLVVVNASGTMNAAVSAERANGMRVELHLSTELPGGLWTVEVRQFGPGARGTQPLRESLAGETLRLPAHGRAMLLAPYPFRGDLFAESRLWVATLELPSAVRSYFERFGVPIRYSYVPRRWPSAAYQTVFATEMGSAEMPSAGRPFTREVVDALFAAGVSFAPIVLHTGVSSLEDHEPPYEERFCVPRQTADRINAAHAAGHRVIAVGTTVVRALETVTDEQGTTHPGEGWTNLVITPNHATRAVDGLITGLHEPRATHLAILQAVVRRGLESAATRATSTLTATNTPHDMNTPHATNTPGATNTLIDSAYREALTTGYLWHEFGDSHLILP